MLRSGVADDLLAAHGEDGYLFPEYGGRCFAGVAATALSVLGADAGAVTGPGIGPLPEDALAGVDTDVDVVVVALVDGYGFRQYERDVDDYPLLGTIADEGRVTPLTSIYPTETAAAITTTHTGLLPAQHGMLGWDQYVEPADSVLQTLPFQTPAGEPAEDVHGLGPEVLLDGSSLYGRLHGEGVDATAVVPEHQLDAPFAQVAQVGLGGEQYADLDGAADALERTVEGADGPTYVYAYFSDVDGAAHQAGTESEQYHESLDAVLDTIESGLVEALPADLAERTLLMLTADHGEVDTPGIDGNVDLRADRFDPLWAGLRRGADGETIPPVGGPRNVHLHLQDGAREEVRSLLEREVEGLVFDREEVLDRDLFGPGEPSDLFRRRLGDLLLVPRDRSVFYAEGGGLDYVGMHGGLHPDEMLVPFAAARVDRLR